MLFNEHDSIGVEAVGASRSECLVNALTGKVRTEPRWSPFQLALDRRSRPRKRYATPSDKINALPTATFTKSPRGMS